MSAVWIMPVADRTQADIDNRTQKAYLNAIDLNRIEGNIAYLSDTLNSYTYQIQPVLPTEWNLEDILNPADIENITDKIKTITEAYYEPIGFIDLSDLPEKSLDYEDINHIEQNLLGIKSLLDSGIHYTTSGELKQYTHGELNAYTHKQIRKALNYPNFL